MSYSNYGDAYDFERFDWNDDGSRQNSSEEDTEEASENEFSSQPMEIKEQMYKDKLANLNAQIESLQKGTHPDYIRRVKKLEYQYNERIRLNEVYREYLRECVERDFSIERKAADKEYDEKKVDLRENLLTDFEDRRKMIESERNTMELTIDSTEVKPTVTRKLRRRPNDPLPVASGEKRRKPTTGQLLVYLLDDKDIDSDLKVITRGKAMTPNPVTQNGIGNMGSSNNYQSGSNLYGMNNYQNMLPDSTTATLLSPSGNIGSPSHNNSYVETRIEDGKLLYERRWYHRGQPVYIEGKDMAKFAANISAIGNEVVWVKKVNDNNKVKINMTHLSKGKITIKRRAN